MVRGKSDRTGDENYFYMNKTNTKGNTRISTNDKINTYPPLCPTQDFILFYQVL